MTRTVKACPDCNSSDLHQRAGGTMSARPDAPSYRCRDCGHEFEHAVERQRLRSSPNWSAKAVLEGIGVDPEEAMVGDE